LHVKSEARVLSCSAVNVASTKIFAVTEQVWNLRVLKDSEQTNNGQWTYR
jgi:hypothetical protein